jgi:hypothetical protein
MMLGMHLVKTDAGVHIEVGAKGASDMMNADWTVRRSGSHYFVELSMVVAKDSQPNDVLVPLEQDRVPLTPLGNTSIAPRCDMRCYKNDTIFSFSELELVPKPLELRGSIVRLIHQSKVHVIATLRVHHNDADLLGVSPRD